MLPKQDTPGREASPGREPPPREANGGTLHDATDIDTTEARLRIAAASEGYTAASIAGLVATLRVAGALDDPQRVRERLASRGYKPSSLAVQLGRVKTCCRLLGLPDVTAGMRRPRRPRSTPKPMTDEQARILLDALPRPHRDWLVLALYAGLRAAEIAAVEGSDLELWSTGPKLRVKGKGGTRLTVPAHPKVVDVITSYGTPGRLWPDATPRSVSHRFKDLAARRGVPVSIHQARHTYASTLYANTHDVLLVQRLMRHAQVTSTVGYIALDDSDALDAVSSL